MHKRSWHWLMVRIEGLLSKPPGFTPDGRTVQATRLGIALNPTVAQRKK